MHWLRGQSIKWWTVLVCLFVYGGVGVPRGFGQHVGSILGQVRADGGQVIPTGVTVRLETREGMPVGQQPVNSAGEFEFGDLRKISYRLTATAEGYQAAEKYIDLGYGADRVIVNLFLVPATKTKTITSEVQSVTDLSAPPGARKEYEKGARALAEKDVPGAVSHFEKAVAEYPCYARAQTDLALALAGTQEWARAEAALKKAIECDASFLDAYAELGQILNAQKRFTESETFLEQGLRHSASAWQFYYQLGVADFGLAQYVKAERDFLKVQSLNPAPPPELHVKLADVYLKQGAYEKAYVAMQSYLRADPSGRFAAKVKGIMQQMETAGVARPASLQSDKSQPQKP